MLFVCYLFQILSIFFEKVLKFLFFFGSALFEKIVLQLIFIIICNTIFFDLICQKHCVNLLLKLL